MTKRYDVAIIGSGPAGSMAGIECARAGLKTILFEKEALPRRKVCAGGLVKKAANILPADLHYPIQVSCSTYQTRVANTSLVFTAEREGIVRMVDRNHFDHALIHYAVARGLTLRDGCRVVDVVPDAGEISIKTGEESIKADYLILAEGANSRFTDQFFGKQALAVPSLEVDLFPPQAVLDEFKGKVIFDLDAIPSGYGWIFYKGDHLSVGVVPLFPGKLNLHQHLDGYLQANRLVENCEIRFKKGFLIPVQARQGELVKNRMMVVGDAAGFADPLSAEGISAALLSGKAGGEAIVQGLQEGSDVAANYRQKIQRPILDELEASARFQHFLYRFPKSRNWLMRAYGPRLQRGMADVIEGKRSMRSISSPSVVLYHLLRFW